MTIKPIVKVIFADGTKRKYEMYNRPQSIVLPRSDGKEVLFNRSGPDEYREYVPKMGRKPLKEERLIVGPNGELN